MLKKRLFVIMCHRCKFSCPEAALSQNWPNVHNRFMRRVLSLCMEVFIEKEGKEMKAK